MLEHLIDNNNTFFIYQTVIITLNILKKRNKNRNIYFVVFCNVDKLEGVLESFLIS